MPTDIQEQIERRRERARAEILKTPFTPPKPGGVISAELEELQVFD